MSDIAGFGGAVTITSTGGTTISTVALEEWSYSFEADEIAIPASFGETWEKATLGQCRIKGSCRGKMETTVAPHPIPASNSGATSVLAATIALGVDTTRSLGSVAALISNFQMSRPHNGVSSVSFDFRNSGTVATNALDWS